MNRSEIMRFLLNKSNMNISELTNQMGVHRTNVYHWRDGITTPKKSTINNLADILNITLLWVNKNEVNVIEGNIHISEEIDMNMDASYIIKLQKEKIEQLEKKVKSMKKKLKNIGK